MALLAAFIAEQTDDSLEVTFTDDSTDAVDYLWQFGDGTISNDPSPTHTYISPGIYGVSLTVTGADTPPLSDTAVLTLTIADPETDPINDPQDPPAPVYNYTAGGYRYEMGWKYKESFARDASMVTAEIKVPWEDAQLIKDDLLGYTEWTSGPQLTRHLPLAVPWSGVGGNNKQYLDRLDMDRWGPDGPPSPETCGADEENDNWVYVDGYAFYTATFRQLAYTILDDAAVAGTSPTVLPAELRRYVRVTRRYLPESQKVPTAGFEIYDPDTPGFVPVVIQEVGSVPGFQIEIVVEAIQWPEDAFPKPAVENGLGKVNSEIVSIRNVAYAAGTLLYKGPASELTPYDDASGRKMLDIPHLFGYRANGWNKHRLLDGTYKPIRVKGTTNTPQFQTHNHNLIFVPGGVV